MKKRIERAVEANQRVGWMGRVNGVMETERGAAIWESMGLPAVNFAVEVSWKGTKEQQKKLDAVQEQVVGLSQLFQTIYRLFYSRFLHHFSLLFQHI